MARPKKWRKVCSLPGCNKFAPQNTTQQNDEVVLFVDEYEAIRLIDYQGFTQEECSKYMNIARSTIQSIYNKARIKIAKALVEGCTISIEGGDYRLCDNLEKNCNCGGCKRHKLQIEEEE